MSVRNSPERPPVTRNKTTAVKRVTQKPKGRPSSYTDQIGDEICRRLASGLSLREICADADMPAQSTVYLWVANDIGGFSEKYARAREAQQLHYADEIIEIADDGTNDWVERKIKGTDIVMLDKEHVSRSNLRVEARKWLMARLARRTFGDRVQADLQQLDGQGKPIQPVQPVLNILIEKK